MHKKFSVLFIILIIFILGGCSKKEKLPAGNDQADILLARDCGMDKLRCCDEDPPCSYSQECCINPNDPEKNYCSDECTFGKKGEFCRKDDPQCENGFTCLNGFCKECGKDSQHCCDNSSCADGLVCFNEKCSKCGVEDNPCCENDKCDNENRIDKTRTGCFDGVCKKCGAGDLACPGTIKCVSGYLYNSGSCFSCGENNEPCCDKLSGKPYECNPAKKLHCDKGFCLE